MNQLLNSDGLLFSFLKSASKGTYGNLRSSAANSYELMDILSYMYIKQGAIDERVKISILIGKPCFLYGHFGYVLLSEPAPR